MVSYTSTETAFLAASGSFLRTQYDKKLERLFIIPSTNIGEEINDCYRRPILSR